MRVLLTTDCVGGVLDHTAALSSRLCADGHQVLVAVIGSPVRGQLEALAADARVEFRPSRLEWMTDAGIDLRDTADWLNHLASRYAADLIHLNQMAYTGLATFDRPTIVVVHSDVLSWLREVEGSDRPVVWEEYASAVQRGLRAATRVVACTQYQAELTRRHYGRGVDLVIPNGVELPGESIAPERDLPLLTVGRGWDRAKGLHVLEEALRLLGDDAPEAHHLGGLRSPDGGEIRLERIRAHGAVPPAEVHAWMSRAAIYVAPSLYEPFGLAPLEAALRGSALLLSDLGSFRELWDGSAIFFERGDPRSLAVSILRLVSDADLRQTMARRARDHAQARYTVDRMAARYLDLYTTLLRPGNRRGDPRSTFDSQRAPAASEPAISR